MKQPIALLVSHVPGQASGLGVQARLLYEAALRAGYHVEAAALSSSALTIPPQRIPWRTSAPIWRVQNPVTYGEAAWLVDHLRPDAVLCLADLWSFVALNDFPEVHAKTHFWLPIDHAKAPVEVLPWIQKAPTFALLSDWMRTVCIAEDARFNAPNLSVVPHGVDHAVFHPVPEELRTSFRRAAGVDGAFVALAVGHNQQRKQMVLLLESWAMFLRGLSDADAARCRLMLHTEMNLDHIDSALAHEAGPDLQVAVTRYWPQIAPTILALSLDATAADMAARYATADVYVTATRGEGFGVPTIEAMACGRASIVPANTTGPELLGTPPDGGVSCLGWCVPCNNIALSAHGLRRHLVDPAAFAAALHAAWELWTQNTLNSEAAVAARVEASRKYSWNTIRDWWTQRLLQTRPVR